MAKAKRLHVRHAQYRARERYGIVLTPAHLRELQERIAAGEGEQIRRAAFHRRVLRLNVHGVPCVVVASGIDHRVITFLPRTEWETSDADA